MNQLSDNQRRKLLENPNVESITESHVHFKGEFKIWAVERYLGGTRPDDLFIEAGIDLSLFEEKYAASNLKRWKKKYMYEGKAALRLNSTGKNATGRPKVEKLEDLSKEQLIELVQMQREMMDEIKKLRALAKKN